MSKVKGRTFPPSVIIQDGTGVSIELPIECFGGTIKIQPAGLLAGYEIAYGALHRDSGEYHYFAHSKGKTPFEAAENMIVIVNEWDGGKGI